MKQIVACCLRFFALAAILPVIMHACNAKRLENTKELSREIKASQIKRVTHTQLIYTVDEWGKKISKIAEKSLLKELKMNPGNSATLCGELSKIPLIAALQKEYGVQIKLLDERAAMDQSLFPKERELVSAYIYSAKTKATASDNVQQLNDTLFVYNAPVAGDNPICKTCMGDQDTPFALWRLRFDKKEIIRKLDAKMLKE